MMSTPTYCCPAANAGRPAASSGRTTRVTPMRQPFTRAAISPTLNGMRFGTRLGSPGVVVGICGSDPVVVDSPARVEGLDDAGFAVDPELEQPVRRIADTALRKMMRRVVRNSF